MDNQTPPPINPPVENTTVQPPPPVFPPASPVQPEIITPHKSFLSGKLIVLIVILLILLAGGGTYLALNSRSKPTPPVSQTTPTSAPTPTVDPTASWQTYTGQDYVVKYPANLTVSEITMIPNKTPVYFKNDLFLEKAFVGIDYYSNSQNKTLQQFITDYSNGLYSKENTETYQVNSSSGLGYINGGNKVIFLTNIDKIYILSLNNAYDPKTNVLINKKANDIFNQILSTFKFTPASPTGGDASQTTDTSTWKTYTNTKIKFSIKYPASLTIEDKSNQFPPFTVFVSDENKQVPYEGGSMINPYMIVQSKNSNLSLNDYINDSNNNLEMVRDQKVEGDNFIVAKEKFGMAVAPENYMIKNGDNILSISNSPYPIDSSTFNQILSTFRFDSP